MALPVITILAIRSLNPLDRPVKRERVFILLVDSAISIDLSCPQNSDRTRISLSEAKDLPHFSYIPHLPGLRLTALWRLRA